MRNVLRALAVVGGLAVASSSAMANMIAYTDSAGRQWADLRLTTPYTWTRAASECPTDGMTACSGTLDGWTWATKDEVANLFAELTGLARSQFETSRYSEVNSTWASAALDAFTPNIPGNTVFQFRSLFGLTASRADNTACGFFGPGDVDTRCAYVAELNDVFAADGADSIYFYDRAEPNLYGPDGGDASWGLFLFRVPEPGTFVLFGLGLLGLGFSRRAIP